MIKVNGNIPKKILVDNMLIDEKPILVDSKYKVIDFFEQDNVFNESFFDIQDE